MKIILGWRQVTKSAVNAADSLAVFVQNPFWILDRYRNADRSCDEKWSCVVEPENWSKANSHANAITFNPDKGKIFTNHSQKIVEPNAECIRFDYLLCTTTLKCLRKKSPLMDPSRGDAVILSHLFVLKPFVIFHTPHKTVFGAKYQGKSTRRMLASFKILVTCQECKVPQSTHES